MEPRPNSESAPSSKSSSKDFLGPFQFHFISLFPELIAPAFGSSLLNRARESGILDYSLTQIRDFASDKHRTVDDSPYGGGEGMLLKVDVLYEAWKAATQAAGRERQAKLCTLLLSPQGRLLDASLAKELATSYTDLVLVCGHYEGVDERFIELCVDQEVSIGDYVLTGGELPALVLADSVARFIPGVVGNGDSVKKDSFEENRLKYPQYTRPHQFMGKEVPEVLLSGDHRAIQKWRDEQSRERTLKRRPHLLEPRK